MDERIKNSLCDNILLIVFGAIIVLAWSYNSLIKQTFNIRDLDGLAMLIGGQHGVNSVFNSFRGYSPGAVAAPNQGGNKNALGGTKLKV